MLGVFEFMPSREATAALFEELCQATPTACVSVLTAVCGFSDRNVNASRLSHYVTYAPSGEGWGLDTCGVLAWMFGEG